MRAIRPGYVVRGYAARGVYWRAPLVTPTAAYLPSEELILTICKVDPFRHADVPYSEFDHPSVEEFRLLAALTLAVDYDDGLVRLQPLSSTLLIETDDLALDCPSVEDEVRRALVAQWRMRSLKHEAPYPPYPPGTYDFRPDAAPTALQRRLFDAVDLDDHLITRGLRTLLRAQMLSTHPFYAEEAIYPLHVALDASHSLFRRQMEAEGHLNPSSKDVAGRFEQVFSEPATGEAYFNDYYSDRVMAQHPLSRYGSVPYVPATHSHAIWLFKALREVYRYFLLGEVIECCQSVAAG